MARGRAGRVVGAQCFSSKIFSASYSAILEIQITDETATC